VAVLLVAAWPGWAASAGGDGTTPPCRRRGHRRRLV